MKKIGITGTIASGKTSVSILLRKHGFSVFNCDQYANMATHAGNPCHPKLVEVLGESVLDEGGDIDRSLMAKIIFNDEDKRRKVNAIVHPYVMEGMHRFFDGRKDEPFAFAEVPLLFEAGMEEEFDVICVVTCSKETAIARMMDDRDYTQEEAVSRYACQIDPALQREKADIVIENDGDLKQLNDCVNAWLAALRKEARRT